jgi:hypothetical protein
VRREGGDKTTPDLPAPLFKADSSGDRAARYELSDLFDEEADDTTELCPPGVLMLSSGLLRAAGPLDVPAGRTCPFGRAAHTAYFDEANAVFALDPQRDGRTPPGAMRPEIGWRIVKAIAFATVFVGVALFAMR